MLQALNDMGRPVHRVRRTADANAVVARADPHAKGRPDQTEIPVTGPVQGASPRGVFNGYRDFQALSLWGRSRSAPSAREPVSALNPLASRELHRIPNHGEQEPRNRQGQHRTIDQI